MLAVFARFSVHAPVVFSGLNRRQTSKKKKYLTTGKFLSFKPSRKVKAPLNKKGVFWLDFVRVPLSGYKKVIDVIPRNLRNFYGAWTALEAILTQTAGHTQSVVYEGLDVLYNPLDFGRIWTDVWILSYKSTAKLKWSAGWSFQW